MALNRSLIEAWGLVGIQATNGFQNYWNSENLNSEDENEQISLKLAVALRSTNPGSALKDQKDNNHPSVEVIIRYYMRNQASGNLAQRAEMRLEQIANEGGTIAKLYLALIYLSENNAIAVQRVLDGAHAPASFLAIYASMVLGALKQVPQRLQLVQYAFPECPTIHYLQLLYQLLKHQYTDALKTLTEPSLQALKSEIPGLYIAEWIANKASNTLAQPDRSLRQYWTSCPEGLYMHLSWGNIGTCFSGFTELQEYAKTKPVKGVVKELITEATELDKVFGLSSAEAVKAYLAN